MPLLKRTPFPLVEPPQDLDPEEPIFQVRFTKEIFKDYQDYLNRINIYRQRFWTCKVTGKSNLTYEEALLSEHRATEKVQGIPNGFIVPILKMVHYSTLNLTDLVEAIYTKLQGHLFVGLDLHGTRNQSVCSCRILKIKESYGIICYEIGWLDKNKNVTDTTTVEGDCLISKKPPVSRSMLKSFIRESTSQSFPWVVHEKLARTHGLPLQLPESFLRDVNGKIITKRKKIPGEDFSAGLEDAKKKLKKEEVTAKIPIKYPIDDHLVEPGADDPIFTKRPLPSRDFKVPMDCVGDLLMVWDFCSSFCRLLNLWPYSLENFEKAICHKDSSPTLIIESHSTLFRLLIKDDGEFFATVQKKKRKSKITPLNWNEYLCDFLEFLDKPELSHHMVTIKRGHYGLLDVNVKLRILCELIAEVLPADLFREKLGEYIEQQQVLAAAKREEVRKKREEQHLKKEPDSMRIDQGSILENRKNNIQPHRTENVEINGNYSLQNGEKKLEVYRRNPTKKAQMNTTINSEELNNSSGIEKSKKLKQSKKEKDGENMEKKTDENVKERIEREIEKRFIRNTPLGKDRNFNRYWFFRRDGRVFVESSDSREWGFYCTREELDAFMGSLNPKGERERALKRQLEKHFPKISLALQKRSKDAATRILLEEAVLRRSTRVRAQPKDSPSTEFLSYINKWKED